MDVRAAVIMALLAAGLCMGWIMKLEKRMTALADHDLKLLDLQGQTVSTLTEISAWITEHERK